MSEHEDTTKTRLETIDKMCQEEIERKKSEIETKQKELHDKQHVSGITIQEQSKYNQEIANLQQGLESLSRNKMALGQLTRAISIAHEEVDAWTPGLMKAIAVVEKYSVYLKEPKGIDELVNQSSEALNLLVEDIKSCSADKGPGGRAVSVLQMVGYEIVGIVLGAFALLGTIKIILLNSPGRKENQQELKSMWGYVGNQFMNAFESYKEAMTGKVEPPELKKLSQELKALNEKYTPATSVATHPHAFHPATSSQKDTDYSIQKGIHNQGHQK